MESRVEFAYAAGGDLVRALPKWLWVWIDRSGVRANHSGNMAMPLPLPGIARVAQNIFLAII